MIWPKLLLAYRKRPLVKGFRFRIVPEFMVQQAEKIEVFCKIEMIGPSAFSSMATISYASGSASANLLCPWRSMTLL